MCSAKVVGTARYGGLRILRRNGIAVLFSIVALLILVDCGFPGIGKEQNPIPSSSSQTPGPGQTPQQTTPQPNASPTTSGNLPNITVTGPASDSEVKSPVQVRGTAAVFEGTVEIVIRNARGEEVGKVFVTASAGAPERGDYAASIVFTTTGGKQNGKLEVFSRSPRDGSIVNLVSIPVVLVPN